MQSITVVGQRESLAGAQAIKREAAGIVDAVVASDIQKLPDLSVVEALQRVTGVQIARDRGDGGGLTVRGLTQVASLLNGREVFTAGNGRGLNFADLPAELVSRLDVHKTASAEHIEGGVGGVIDLRTRRPFDSPGRVWALSARSLHGDLVRRSGEQAALLFSDRWHTAGAGEFGALVSLSVQRRAWREDQKSTGAPVARHYDPDTATLPSAAGADSGLPLLFAPSSTTENTSLGRRERSAGHLHLQWRPAPGWELYAEASRARFETRQDTYQINVFTAGAAGEDLSLFPGGTGLQRVTWLDAPLSILSFARDTVDEIDQAALGGEWRSGALTLSADLSRTRSFNDLFFSGPVLSGTAARFTHDVSGTVPATSLAGTDLLDPANLRFTSIAYRVLPFHGELDAARLDAELALTHRWLESLQAGARHARRGAHNAPGLLFGDTAVDLPAATLPGALRPRPHDNLLPGSTSLHDYLVGDLALARDAAALRDAFGIDAPLPTEGNPLGLWTIRETTQAGYLIARWRAPAAPLDGRIGLRVVRTHESVDGWQSLPGSTAPTPIDVRSRYTDWLPSLDLRWVPRAGWALRAAASRTVTRPDFNQLSPSLTLIRNTAAPATACPNPPNTGSGGNPDLKPIRADNLDLAVERYLSRHTSAAVTLFRKNVDGFVATVTSCEVHAGTAYSVSRPQNSHPAQISGAELAYQQFFDFLPGWAGGLGLQANYTYIDSETPNSTLGARVPLQNLSRHSANLVGLYERGAVSLRVAYNWRDRFRSGEAVVAGVGSPVYTRGYGWLDASLSWRATRQLTLTLEGANLLRTQRSSYYGEPTQPHSVWLNDRQIGLAASLRF